MTTAKYYIPSGRCIQGVSYQDGEPVDIPEEERAIFYTRNKREVRDGGGVKPDVLIDRDGDSGILKRLLREHLIFDYATKYCQKYQEIAIPQDFNFTEFDDFLEFLERKNFDYDTKTEKLLKDLKARAKKDGYVVEEDIKALEKKINAAKKNDVLKYKNAIIDLIEKEIVGRFYYQKGKIQIGLRNDKEIKEAVALLGDSAQYKKLLQK